MALPDVTEPGEAHPAAAGSTSSASVPRRRPSPDTSIMAAAVFAPVATAAFLIPWRSQLDTADNALILVVVIVAIASTGRRVAAAVAALVSALSFDYFLTRPYYSFRIIRHEDLITEILLLVVGLAVGELAARGRAHRTAASQSRHQMTLLHRATELVSTGQDATLVVRAARDDLIELLSLRSCSFHEGAPVGVTARVTPAGQVTIGNEIWPTSELGLPSAGVDLPVRSGGWLLGHFVLNPTPGEPIPPDRLLVAVGLADLVGAALATERKATG